MRAHYVITVIALILIGLGAKQFFVPAMVAQGDIEATASANLNVLQMQIDNPNIKGLPVQKTNDMTFVFSDDQ